MRVTSELSDGELSDGELSRAVVSELARAIPVAILLAESWGAIPVAISIAESWNRRGRAMENSREGWNNRGSDGNRGSGGSRVIFERYRPPRDTVLKRYRVAFFLATRNGCRRLE